MPVLTSKPSRMLLPPCETVAPTVWATMLAQRGADPACTQLWIAGHCNPMTTAFPAVLCAHRQMLQVDLAKMQEPMPLIHRSALVGGLQSHALAP